MPFFSMSARRVRRDDRRRRAPRACATSSSRRARTRRRSSSSTRSTRSAARAARWRSAARASRSRRSTRSSPRWTASRAARASSCWPRPTSPTCSTRRCCGRAASIGASSSTCRTRTAARRSSRFTRATCRSASDVDLAELAAATPGFSGADLKNLVNEAALLAARREQDDVRQKDFLDALEKIVLGPERPLLLTREDRERIAYHEGGHAILGLVVPGADPVHRVTIVPRGQALGVTYQRPRHRSLQLSGGLPARAHRRHARRARGRGDRVRHEDDRRGERHRAGDRLSRAAWSRAGA